MYVVESQMHVLLGIGFDQLHMFPIIGMDTSRHHVFILQAQLLLPCPN